MEDEVWSSKALCTHIRFLEVIFDPAAIPLQHLQSTAFASGRFALVGDACRTVHPLAGQGVNLGLADVAVLVNALSDGLEVCWLIASNLVHCSGITFH